MISLYDGKYHIEDDTTCYKMTRKTVSKTNKVNYTLCGYFSNIQEALKRIYDDEVKKAVNENDYTDLKSVIAEMWSIQEVVKQEIAKAVVERSDLK